MPYFEFGFGRVGISVPVARLPASLKGTQRAASAPPTSFSLPHLLFVRSSIIHLFSPPARGREHANCCPDPRLSVVVAPRGDCDALPEMRRPPKLLLWMAFRSVTKLPSLPFLVLAIVTLVKAQTCAFTDDSCIDPLAQTAVPLSFSPLFPQNITFYYGFDAAYLSASEGLSLDGQSEGPIVKGSFWLGYGSHMSSTDVHANHTSEVAVRVGNLTGSPSGGNNGCDGVWGSECSQEIKHLLQGSIYDLSVMGSYYSNPLQTVLRQLWQTPLAIVSCPSTLFTVQTIPAESFAQENEVGQSVQIMDPGNSVSPWQTWFVHGVSASEQAEQVAVGILSRGPTYASEPLKSPHDVQIELVCVRAPQEAR
ncbi:hypothetical protein DTO271D3_8646 [Paecilomyces variotii]|nr:hypothetical protein DTO169E5_1791 [Paecilomyces variotii]KAJ9311057.1 hypothetical protein DTO271D3_8646 [Paecilomyces variotii]